MYLSNKKAPKRRILNVGDTVFNGKYEILKVIHTSGMANVYLVLDNNLRKQWCLKEIIKSEAGRDNIEYYSLIREASIMKRLNHPSIPRIVTIEEDGDSVFIVEDYVDGISALTWMMRNGGIGQERAVDWLKQVCDVLIYLHNRKNPIIYFDMKPENIMIQNDEKIKVLDFGISDIITEDNHTVKKPLGTPGYASPEQSIVGSEYDLRSDIYSLGKTFYHMLTGISPRVVKGDLKPLREVDSSLSMGLEVIINKCIQKNPDDRYQSVEEVLYDLKNYEKLDSKYISGVKKKIWFTIGLFLTSVFFICGSFVPLGIYNVQQGSAYYALVELANQTERTSDYIEAISMRPLEIKPYFGLIKSFKQDGVFTKEEEKEFLNLIYPNLKGLKSKDNYGKLSFEIGKLYWYYYDGSDGDTVSNRWFLEAIECGYNVDESQLYYDLGNFKKTVSMAIAESDDSGIYLEYWSNLMRSKEVDSGEIMELRVYNSIADAINIYSYRLRVDGVPKKEIDDEIKAIQKYIKSSNPTSEKSIELRDSLVEKAKTLQEKADIAYSEGGE